MASQTPPPPSEPCDRHLLDNCPICGSNPEPRRASDMVYVTEYGKEYHYRPDCPRLEYGQQLVIERGGTPSPIEMVAEDSVKYRLSPCSHCKPGSKHNPR